MKNLFLFLALALFAAVPAFAADAAIPEPQFLTQITYNTTDAELVAKARAELDANPAFAEKYGYYAMDTLPIVEEWLKHEPQSYEELLQSIAKGKHVDENGNFAHQLARRLCFWHPRFYKFWPEAVEDLRGGLTPDAGDMDLCVHRSGNLPALDPELAWQILADRFSTGMFWGWDYAVDRGIDDLVKYAAECNRPDEEVKLVLKRLNRNLSLRMIDDKAKWERIVVKIRTLLETY